MDTIISLIGLIISTLMGFPSLLVSLTDSDKRRLCHALFDLTQQFEQIINTGQSILEELKAIPFDGNDWEENARKRKFIEQLEIQAYNIVQLRKNLRKIQHVGGYGFYQFRKVDVSKVLSIYKPDLGENITETLGIKLSGLTDLRLIFYKQFKKAIDDDMVLSEISSIVPSGFREFRGENIESFRTINLKDKKERAEYIKQAQSRLDELEVGRLKLVDLIKEHFEPHHLL